MNIDQFTDDIVLIKRLLDGKSAFYPIDFLIQSGYLSLQEYLKWEQDKGRDYLERKIAISPKVLEERLRCICEVAEKLSGGSTEIERIELGKPPFRASEVRKYFNTIYFSNGSRDAEFSTLMTSNNLCHVLIEKMLSTSREEVQKIWQQINPIIPDWYPWRNDLAMLVGTDKQLAQIEQTPENIFTHIEKEISPTVKRVFGDNSTKFINPIWHHSKKLIEQVHCWRNDPKLLLFNAIVSKHLDDHKAALGLFCEVCWIAPNLSKVAMQEKRFPDKILNDWWETFHEGDELCTDSFPSFLLLQGYKKHDFDKANVQKAPEDFKIVMELTLNPTEIRLRAQLKVVNPKLFKIFMSHRS